MSPGPGCQGDGGRLQEALVAQDEDATDAEDESPLNLSLSQQMTREALLESDAGGGGEIHSHPTPHGLSQPAAAVPSPEYLGLLPANQRPGGVV